MSTDRYRCLITGCNPDLYDEKQAIKHRHDTGHRTGKWPVRSAEGRRRARQRNKSGYYDKYNTGAKSRNIRLGLPDIEGGETAFGEDDF